VVILTILVLAGCNRDGDPVPSESLAEAADDTWSEHVAKHQDVSYVCPMHPQIVRDAPGSCPICGMDLVPREADVHVNAEAPVVTIRPEVIQSLGVRTAKAERGRLWMRVDTVGRVEYDQNRVAHVHPRANGWVEKLYVGAEGDPVKEGEILLDMYSPDVVNAQEEFLLALREGVGQSRIAPARTRELVSSARTRLHLFAVPDAVIDEIERTGEVQHTVPIQSTHAGVVTHLGVRDGMYLQPSMELFTIVDVSKVWVQVDVFEHQMDWVQRGRLADMSVPARPGRTWKGEVDYIYPELDPQTRTLRVRLRFDNPDGVLKPNMYADVVVWGGPKDDVLHIPREALIATGKREKVVLDRGEGRFQPVEVTTGMRSADRVEVLTGLEEGDAVVVSGQFLIDSESNLQASFQRMSDAGSAGRTGHTSHAH
jgi:Cu(I)/Ag(I) efflux system membrane fusion protein